jgi:hypothetical protein
MNNIERIFVQGILFVLIMSFFRSQGLIRPSLLTDAPKSSRLGVGVFGILLFVGATGLWIYKFKKFNEKRKNRRNIITNLIFIVFICSGLYFAYRGIKHNFL